MKLNAKKLLCLVVLLSAMAPFASGGAAAQTPNGGGAKFRYQIYESPGEMMFRVMEDKGFCEKYGLKCEGIRITNGPLGIQALLGNSLELGFIGTDAGIRAITGGARVKFVLGVGNRVPYYVVARKDFPWTGKERTYPAAMQEFKGKRIGVTARGASTELIFNLLLQDAGLSHDSVTYVAVGGPPTAFGSLSSKQIDAAIQVPPTAEICDHSSVCETIFNLPTEKTIPAVSRLEGAGVTAMMSDEFVEKNPKVVEAFVAAAQEANKWMKDPANLEEYIAIGKKYLKVNVPDADVVIRETLQRQLQISDPRVNRKAIQVFIDVLYDAKLTPRKLGPDDVISKFAPAS
ncbi:NitT/TauT family transport system substrate-binding protein [Bradyrhizobium sp. AZCC 1719]|uniref:ABC transporter substrate-binding protein n=1 Tax=Bradyrhizobium sp. AZCC 1719 TaxID=3117028 RepID=UPI002FEFD5AE